MRSTLRTVDDRYDLVRVLGEGGVGTVWLARDRKLRRNVALKIIDSGASTADPRREFDILQRLQADPHERERPQNVILVHDFGWSATPDGERFAYYTMEYVDGDLISKYRWTDDEELVYICLQCLRTLARLHAAGVLHGDIKSLNIMVYRQARDIAFGAPTTWRDSPPVVVFLDFGFSLELRGLESIALDGKLLEGKPGKSVPWMPPELLLAEREGRPLMLTERSDIYALGAVFYELASRTGERAFPEPSSKDVLRHKLDPNYGPPTLEEIPRKVSEVIHSMMSYSPTARPRAAEAEETLQQLMPHLTLETRERRLAEIRSLVEFVDVEGAAEKVGADLAVAMTSTQSGNTFLLDGEEGIGKSRLLRELPRFLHAQPSFKVVVFSARQPLDRLAGTLADAFEVPKHAHQFQMLVQAKGRSTAGRLERDLRLMLFEFMRLEGRPVVLALDDGQFMDRDVSKLVASVAKELQGRRILFVLAGQFGGTTPEGFDRPQAIKCKPLTERGVERYIGLKLRAQVPRELVSEVFRQAHGNPGKTNDLLRRLLAEGRVERKDGGPVALKEGSSGADFGATVTIRSARQRLVLGILEAVPSYMGVRVEDVADASGLEQEVLHAELRHLQRLELVDHDLVHFRPRRATPMVRGSDLATKERKRVAARSVRLCERLEEREPDDAARLDLAYHRADHLATAGRPKEAIELALGHAPRYQEAGFTKKALDLYLLVIRSCEELKSPSAQDHEAWQKALLGAATCERKAAKDREASTFFEHAVRHAKKHMTVADQVRAMVRYVQLIAAEAGKALEEAMALLPELGEHDRELELEVLAAKAHQLAESERTRRQGLAMYDDVFVGYGKLGIEPPLGIRIQRGYHRTLAQSDDPPTERQQMVEKGIQEMEEVLARAETSGDREAALKASTSLSWACTNYDRWREARDYTLKRLATCRKMDDRVAERNARQYLVYILGYTGPVELLRREADDFLATSSPQSFQSSRVRRELAALAFHEGDLARAMEAAAEIAGAAERRLAETPRVDKTNLEWLLAISWGGRRIEARCLSEIGLVDEALDALGTVRRSVEASETRSGVAWDLLEQDIDEVQLHLEFLRSTKYLQSAALPRITAEEVVTRLERSIEVAEGLHQRMYGGILKAMLVEARSLALASVQPSLEARALADIQGLGVPVQEAQVRRHLAEACRERNPREAVVHAQQGLAERDLKSNPLQWRLHALAADLQLRSDDRTGAEGHYRQALAYVLKIQAYLEDYRRATGKAKYRAAFLETPLVNHVLERTEELQKVKV